MRQHFLFLHHHQHRRHVPYVCTTAYFFCTARTLRFGTATPKLWSMLQCMGCLGSHGHCHRARLQNHACPCRRHVTHCRILTYPYMWLARLFAVHSYGVSVDLTFPMSSQLTADVSMAPVCSDNNNTLVSCLNECLLMDSSTSIDAKC